MSSRNCLTDLEEYVISNIPRKKVAFSILFETQKVRRRVLYFWIIHIKDYTMLQC